MSKKLENTINNMTRGQCGVLAADESVPTITKRLQAVGLESTEATRLAYRTMLLTTPQLNQYVAAVILHEETLNQQIEGLSVPQYCIQNNIMPGIKVDLGLLPFNSHEKITQGIDGLDQRLTTYIKQGAVFCKWRAVFNVSHPHKTATQVNTQRLAMYAKICQNHDLVPIVEPEVLIDGDHTLEQCFHVCEEVLHQTFVALYQHQVNLETIVLKPSMVIPGKQCPNQASVQDVAHATLTVLKRHVPSAVPTINFLSGGQTPKQATDHLILMNQLATPKPWRLSFSYARALQEPCLAQWAKEPNNAKLAQEKLLERAMANCATKLETA